MFELMLQADKALAEGQLERAERTYWQLIELDPGNAIALAGLARFSLERGDKRLARTLSNRALGIDPDSVVAKRVIEALERHDSAPELGPVTDLTMVAAEQLEALGRKRRGTTDDSEATDSGRKRRGSDSSEPAHEFAAPPGSARAARQSIRTAIEAEAAGATEPTEWTEMAESSETTVSTGEAEETASRRLAFRRGG